MILFIDVSNPEVTLALIDQVMIRRLKFASQRLSESLLSAVEKFLRKNKLKIVDLKKIAVVTGPGPFSRMRTAVATANALAYALNIPVVGIISPLGTSDSLPRSLPRAGDEGGLETKFSNLTPPTPSYSKRGLNKFIKPVFPFYQKPPNITKPKIR